MFFIPYSKTVNPAKICDEIAAAIAGNGLFFSVESEAGVMTGISITEEPSLEVKALIDAAVDAHESVSLSEAKAKRTAAIKIEREAYFLAYDYDERNIQILGSLMLDAQATGKTNRYNYIRQAHAWSIAVMTYWATVAATINAKATVEAVNAVTFDIAANTGAVPSVTITGALAIAD